MSTDQLLPELRRLRGATARIAERCNITRSAVSQWRQVPSDRMDDVIAVAREMGIKVTAPSPAERGQDA